MNNLGFSENELLEQIEPVYRQISFEISESMQSGCEIIQFILEELDGMSMSIKYGSKIEILKNFIDNLPYPSWIYKNALKKYNSNASKILHSKCLSNFMVQPLLGISMVYIVNLFIKVHEQFLNNAFYIMSKIVIFEKETKFAKLDQNYHENIFERILTDLLSSKFRPHPPFEFDGDDKLGYMTYQYILRFCYCASYLKGDVDIEQLKAIKDEFVVVAIKTKHKNDQKFQIHASDIAKYILSVYDERLSEKFIMNLSYAVIKDKIPFEVGEKRSLEDLLKIFG